MSVDYKAIGQRIKEKRKILKRTQESMAETLDVSVGYISQIERGVSKPNLEMLSDVSAFLSCDISELITGTAPKQDNYLGADFELRLKSLSKFQKKILLEIADVLINNKIS